MITLHSDKIIISKDECFDPKAIFECGQVFRYTCSNDVYTVYAGDYCATVIEQGDCYEILTSNVDYFYTYFDLATDYNMIIESIKDKPLMKESLIFGKGLRILRQEHFENIISFIISANNNVPRIKGIIERIAKSLGAFHGSYYGFPTVKIMANQSEEFYKSLGAGYRASYLLSTAKAIDYGFDINSLEKLDTQNAKRELLKLKGIGSKVADCILLFSYSRKDVFPVDTWIKKVYGRLCNNEECVEKMREYLIDLYGEYAGYAQQYLFYSHRSSNGATISIN
ncbi:MAG: DNA-3-methyladenine glycosylase 2 [Clostridia bacterium]|nr:DNA-3-methyladenine glycosylase 2 [Clostridia bacterium]